MYLKNTFHALRALNSEPTEVTSRFPHPGAISTVVFVLRKPLLVFFFLVFHCLVQGFREEEGYPGREVFREPYGVGYHHIRHAHYHLSNIPFELITFLMLATESSFTRAHCSEV